MFLNIKTKYLQDPDNEIEIENEQEMKVILNHIFNIFC